MNKILLPCVIGVFYELNYIMLQLMKKSLLKWQEENEIAFIERKSVKFTEYTEKRI